MLHLLNYIFKSIISVSLIVSLYNIYLSNKQSVFQRRLEIYLLIKSLKSLIIKNNDIIDIPKEIDMVNEIHFSDMTNISSLAKHKDIIKNPNDTEIKDSFLTALEHFEKLSTEITFIFKGSCAPIFSNFLLAYKNVLYQRYRYQILLIKMEEFKNPKILTLNQISKLYNEENYRKELVESINELRKTYNALSSYPSYKIKNQIQLFFNPLNSIKYYWNLIFEKIKIF